MSDTNIQVNVTDRVGIITLNRPRVHNALDRETVREVVEQMEAFNVDRRVRVIVINGSGPAFAAGADIRELRDATPKSLELDEACECKERIRGIDDGVVGLV